MIPSNDWARSSRWTAGTFDTPPEVVETTLYLSREKFLILEAAANRHHMTVGQLVRVMIARGLTALDLSKDHPENSNES